ncbi:MAG: hypothetical protein A2X55_07420 [Nitrospirae bacterium GWB2_47_37]|nr:MAG: hypothetical protein A2X55_07420 [Nitrospirae bacterium GWB2_47_37]
MLDKDKRPHANLMMDNPANENVGKKSLPVFICLLALLFFSVDLITELGVADGVLYVSVVLLSMSLPQRRYIIIFAGMSSLLTVLGFFLSPPGGELWKVIANRLLSLYAIWVTAILSLQRKKAEGEREKVIDDLREANSKIKILSGLLPICASCKKIRDDKGYWNRIETYIHDHSEAEFSHGICPDCAKKLYPEYYKEKEKTG